MSKPKDFNSWPPERQEEWRESRRLRVRKWYATKGKAYHERWRAENEKKVKDALAKYKEKNPVEVKRRTKDWISKNAEKVRSSHQNWRVSNRDKVKSQHQRKLHVMPISYLAKSLNIPTDVLKDLPHELIEAKRKEIRTKRILKQITQQIDEQTHE